LQLHRWSWIGWFAFNFNHKLNRSRWISDAFPLSTNNPTRRGELKRATGRLPSLQLAPGCGRTTQRPSLTHPKFPVLFTHELPLTAIYVNNRLEGNALETINAMVEDTPR